MYNFFGYLRGHAVLAGTIAIVAVAGALIAGRVANRDAAAPTDTNVKQVSLVEARTFRTGLSTVAADGIVESISQVDLRSQVSAPLSSVNFSLGDNIAAGSVIAEFQNADIRAQLEQAKATLAIAKSQRTGSQISLTSARDTLIEKIRDSHVAALQTFNTNFSEKGDLIEFAKYVALRQAYDKISTNIIIFNSTQDEWKEAIDSLSSSSSDREVLAVAKMSRENLSRLAVVFDDLLAELNRFIEGYTDTTQSDAWKATISAARSLISGALNSLTATEGALSGAGVSYNSVAEAQISLAEAGVRNLEAQLAKTVIRSPISGKIASLPLRRGELASPGQLIATVVGSGGLQVKAYASGEDFARIKKNARATIRGTIQAVVTSVAPSVNSENKKLEVKLSVINSAGSNLVVGQSVQALIESSAKVPVTSSATYLLPMQNVKIVPGEAYVLTVDSTSKITKHPVTLGEVRGEFVEVKNGLTDSLMIVTPVYELNEGEIVRIQ